MNPAFASSASSALAAGKLSQADHDFFLRMTSPEASFNWADLLKFLPLLSVVFPQFAVILQFLPKIQEIIAIITSIIKGVPVVVPPNGDGPPLPK